MDVCRKLAEDEVKKYAPQGTKQARKFVLTSGYLTTELIVVVVMMLIIYFFLTTCLAVYETVSTPLTVDNYGWSVTQNAIMWTVIVRD